MHLAAGKDAQGVGTPVTPIEILADVADAQSKLSHKSEKPILAGLFPWERPAIPAWVTVQAGVVAFVV